MLIKNSVQNSFLNNKCIFVIVSAKCPLSSAKRHLGILPRQNANLNMKDLFQKQDDIGMSLFRIRISYPRKTWTLLNLAKISSL